MMKFLKKDQYQENKVGLYKERSHRYNDFLYKF